MFRLRTWALLFAVCLASCSAQSIDTAAFLRSLVNSGAVTTQQLQALINILNSVLTTATNAPNTTRLPTRPPSPMNVLQQLLKEPQYAIQLANLDPEERNALAFLKPNQIGDVRNIFNQGGDLEDSLHRLLIQSGNPFAAALLDK